MPAFHCASLADRSGIVSSCQTKAFLAAKSLFYLKYLGILFTVRNYSGPNIAEYMYVYAHACFITLVVVFYDCQI